MKDDQSTRTAAQAGESVHPDWQTSPPTRSEEEPAHDERDRFSAVIAGLSPGSVPDEAGVELLAAKLNQLSEGHDEKLALIKEAIQKGNYQLSPERAAEAMVCEMEARGMRRGSVVEEKDKTVASVSDPPKPHSRRGSAPQKRHRRVLRSPRHVDFKENSEPSHSRADSDQIDGSA